MNRHSYARQGVSFQEKKDGQRNAAFGLMRASLSARGLGTDAQHNNHEFLGEWMYYIPSWACRPRPSRGAGNSAAITRSSIYFVPGHQVVITPYFAGSEPVIAPASKGTTILQQAQNDGLAMLDTWPPPR